MVRPTLVVTDGRHCRSHQRVWLSDCRHGWSALYDPLHLVTNNIKAKLAEANVTLIKLIDRCRMLDNDIIRLQQKLDTAIEMREVSKNETINGD